MSIYKEAGRDERGMFPAPRENLSDILDVLNRSLVEAADKRTQEGKLSFGEALKVFSLRAEINRLIDKIKPRG